MAVPSVPGASPTPTPQPTAPNPVSDRLTAWANLLKEEDENATVTYGDLVKFTEGFSEVLKGR